MNVVEIGVRARDWSYGIPREHVTAMVRNILERSVAEKNHG
jgi:hypothetical protein